MELTLKQQIEAARAVVATLEEAKAKIVDPANWIQGTWATDKDGSSVGVRTESATCFCAGGALRTSAPEGSVALDSAWYLLARFVGPSDNLVSFNDTHTHAEVLALFDKAIEHEKNVLITLNLSALIEAVKAQPEDQFDLEAFKQEVTGEDKNVCKTLFCTAGLATTMPVFQDAGMQLVPIGRLHCIHKFDVEVNGRKAYLGAADPIFGDNSFNILFDPRGYGDIDDQHPGHAGDTYYIDESVTDKALALWRLEYQLATYKEKLA